MKEKNKSKKLPYNTFRKGIVAGIMGLTLGLGAFGLTACSDGKDGLNGTQWYSGTETPTTQGVNGDYYFDTDDYLLYQKTNGQWQIIVRDFGKKGDDATAPTVSINSDGYWVINGVATDVKAKGEDGEDGDDGHTPTITINAEGYWVIDGTATNVTAKGDKGDPGTAGKDGTNIYVGYDGYVWQDGVRTTFKLNQDEEVNKGVVEDTIGAYTTMGYWAGEYVDLSANTIALMANFKPNAKLTQYSGTKVTEIQVVAESAGTLHIGTAKVADVVTARTNGTTYTTNTTEHTLVAGVNTITLDLTVDDDETIVLGGSGSTAKVYVVKNIPVSDEQGNYALVNGSANTDIISKTGDYADTLAVRVKATFNSDLVSVIESVTTDFPESSISSSETVTVNAGPFSYYNRGYYASKTINSVGVPIKSISDNTTNQIFTLYVVKQSQTGGYLTAYESKYELILPANTYSSTTVNKWHYFDVSSLNITVGADETLAFCSTSDTVLWGYSKASASANTYWFHDQLGNTRQFNIYFDVIASQEITIEEHLEALEEKEQEAIRLANENTLRGYL